MKRTRFRGMTGRERIVALVPDRQVSYAYVTGIFKPYRARRHLDPRAFHLLLGLCGIRFASSQESEGVPAEMRRWSGRRRGVAAGPVGGEGSVALATP